MKQDLFSILPEKIKMCSKYPEYENVKQFEKGHLFINGELVDLVPYMEEGKVIKLEEIKREVNNISLEDF